MTTNLVVIGSGTSDTLRSMYSSDGATFTQATMPTFSNGAGTGWSCITFAAELGISGRFVALQQNGIQNNNNDGAYSDDGGATWSGFAMPSSHVWKGICWNGSLFVAVGDGGAVATSPDGFTWTIRTAAEANDWKDVAWNGTVFCAVSFNGTHRSMTSTDGITWTATNISAAAAGTRQWNSVCWSPTLGKFLATGFCFGVIATSTDGSTWTDHDVSATTSTYQYFRVRWSEALGEYCMVGGNGGQVAVSADGLTWTRTDSAGGNTGANDSVCYSTVLNKWVVVGNNRITIGDGSTWTNLSGIPSTTGTHDIAAGTVAPVVYTSLNALDGGAVTLSNGNTTATATAASNSGVRAIDPQYVGKFYIECDIGAQWGTSKIGLGTLGANPKTVASDWDQALLWQSTGSVKKDESNFATIATYAATNNTQWAINLTDKLAWMRVNGGNWNNSGTANPATNTGGLDISSICLAGLYPIVGFAASGDSCTWHFDPAGFTGTAPAGYTAGWPQQTAIPYGDGGGATHAQGGGSSLSVTLNTTGPNRRLVMLVNTEVVSGSPRTVTGIATTGLTWSKRSGQVYQTFNNMEVWEAYASAQLTAASALISLSGAVDQVTACLIPFVNTDTTTIWDGNVSLPATNTNTTGNATVNVSTDNGGLLLGFYGMGASAQPGTFPVENGSDCQYLQGVRDGGGTNYNFSSIVGRYEPSAVTAQSLTMAQGGNKWGMIGDSLLIAGSPPSPLHLGPETVLDESIVTGVPTFIDPALFLGPETILDESIVAASPTFSLQLVENVQDESVVSGTPTLIGTDSAPPIQSIVVVVGI